MDTNTTLSLQQSSSMKKPGVGLSLLQSLPYLQYTLSIWVWEQPVSELLFDLIISITPGQLNQTPISPIID